MWYKYVYSVLTVPDNLDATITLFIILNALNVFGSQSSDKATLLMKGASSSNAPTSKPVSLTDVFKMEDESDDKSSAGFNKIITTSRSAVTSGLV